MIQQPVKAGIIRSKICINKVKIHCNTKLFIREFQETYNGILNGIDLFCRGRTIDSTVIIELRFNITVPCDKPITYQNIGKGVDIGYARLCRDTEQ